MCKKDLKFRIFADSELLTTDKGINTTILIGRQYYGSENFRQMDDSPANTAVSPAPAILKFPEICRSRGIMILDCDGTEVLF